MSVGWVTYVLYQFVVMAEQNFWLKTSHNITLSNDYAIHI